LLARHGAVRLRRDSEARLPRHHGRDSLLLALHHLRQPARRYRVHRGQPAGRGEVARTARVATATLTGIEGHRRLRSAERPLILRAWDQFNRNRLARFGVGFLVVLGLAALLAPIVTPYDPNAIDLQPTGVLQPP